LAGYEKEKELPHDKVGSSEQIPKEAGGLDFLDVRAMNVCLMAKWIENLERGDTNMFCELFRKNNTWARIAYS
jgi:hypothetical protein